MRLPRGNSAWILADVASIHGCPGSSTRRGDVPSPRSSRSIQSTVQIWDSNAEGKSRNAHRTLKMTDQVFSIFQPPSRHSRYLGLSFTEDEWTEDNPAESSPTDHTWTAGPGRKVPGRLRCRVPTIRLSAHFCDSLCLGGRFAARLAKILGHADLSLLMRYVHPSQVDMDRAMEWYNGAPTPVFHDLEQHIVGEGNWEQQGWPRPPFRPPDGPNVAEKGQTRANSEDGKRMSPMGILDTRDLR